VLDMTALAGIVAHVPADLTVTVAAGTRFAEVRSALARAGQFLPLDPPHADAATIGGIVAANSNGFWRSRYGGVRDLLIGTTAVLGDGTVARSGGRVVKNVAGYDLNKLFVGSLGTLGVLVECTFKVLPRPPVSSGAHAQFARSADAFAAADAIARTSARPAALAISGGPGGAWELLLEADGDAAPVERTLELFSRSTRAHGASAQRHEGMPAGTARSCGRRYRSPRSPRSRRARHGSKASPSSWPTPRAGSCAWFCAPTTRSSSAAPTRCSRPRACAAAPLGSSGGPSHCARVFTRGATPSQRVSSSCAG